MSAPLIIFDFDSSLVWEDSDQLVFQNTNPSYYDEACKLYNDQNSIYYHEWSMLMNYYLHRLMKETNATTMADNIPISDNKLLTIERLNEILCTMPVDSDILYSIKLAAKSGATLIIISDANEYYIRTILKYLNIEHLFTKIYTNYGIINEENVLNIISYQSYTTLSTASSSSSSSSSHSLRMKNDNEGSNVHDDQSINTIHQVVLHEQCPYQCSKNLCKGKILKEFLQEYRPTDINGTHTTYHPIIYIGDGNGDYCPTTQLTNPNDIILCRQDWSLHHRLQNSTPSGAKIIPWFDGKIIRQTFENLFNETSLEEEDNL